MEKGDNGFHCNQEKQAETGKSQETGLTMVSRRTRKTGKQKRVRRQKRHSDEETMASKDTQNAGESSDMRIYVFCMTRDTGKSRQIGQ